MKCKFRVIVCIVLSLSVVTGIFGNGGAFFFGECVRATSTSYYVDNAATGSNSGGNWDNAWQSFADISWAMIQPGDTIYISGGTAGQTYNEQLKINKSGTEGNEITIRTGQEAPHNGRVIITNNNGQTGYLGDGIFVNGRSYITIDGSLDGNINLIIQNCDTNGIDVSGNSHHIAVRYVEVGNNGNERLENGVLLNYASGVENQDLIMELSNSKIHDNRQDQIRITGSRGPNMFGRVQIFNNEVYGLYDDGIECGVRGVDIYNNHFHTFNRHLASTDHPDGIVTAAGYVRVHHNLLYDLYSSTPDEFFGNNLYLGLYNNVDASPVEEAYIYYYNNVVIQPVEEPNALNVSNKGLELGGHTNITSLSNVVIANNTFIGTPGLGMSLDFGPRNDSTLDDIKIVNNVVYNCGRVLSIGAVLLENNQYSQFDVGPDDSHKVMFNGNVINSGSEGNDEIKYQNVILTYDAFVAQTGTQTMGGNFDPELLPPGYVPADEDSPVVNAGIGYDILGTYFQDDYAGTPRPQTGNWDIGAYQYVSGY